MSPSDYKKMKNIIEWMINNGYNSFLIRFLRCETTNGCVDVDKPSDHNIWNEAGLRYIHRGDYQSAREVYAEMIITFQDIEKNRGKRIHKGTPYHNLGFVYASQGKINEAIDTTLKAYKEDLISFGEIHSKPLPAYKNLDAWDSQFPNKKIKEKMILEIDKTKIDREKEQLDIEKDKLEEYRKLYLDEEKMK